MRVLVVLLALQVFGQNESRVKFVFVNEKGQEEFVKWFEDSIRSVDGQAGIKYDLLVATVGHEQEDTKQVCESLSKGGNFIIDVTWTGNEQAKSTAMDLNIPYIRVDLSISPVLDLLDKYLTLRNSSDVVIIFENPKCIDQALYYWIDSTRLRMVISDKLDSVAAERLKEMRPMPNNYAIIAASDTMESVYQVATQSGLVAFPERWNLVFLDFPTEIPRSLKVHQMNILQMSKDVCCRLQSTPGCSCRDFSPQRSFLQGIVQQVAETLAELAADDYKPSSEVQCPNTKYDESTKRRFERLFAVSNDNFWEVDGVYRVRISGSVEVVSESGSLDTVAKLNKNQELKEEPGVEIRPVKAFYRVGVTHAMPWSYQEMDPKTGALRWTGYCIDFLEKLSEMMDFDYELVKPKNGSFGEKDSEGRWDGLVGDIARGETEMAVSALVTTADREEVVDFVPPYFEQSGISIVMRKPVRKTSLFKFMTVLKLEVWLSIVAALIITAFMIWFLDKYSPYSAKNNKDAYPYQCRDFSLKESFWFTLTSFTPQGGGEAPKSLSARTLVAAYWLFVVLMLATFTANLAAFLTVERMQIPVQSLEQLAQQSRINYTVVEGSDTHKYFINMKFAEDTLYRMWKELTLNASTDDTRFRVWDYPIREQYGHILLAINESMPVANASEGFRIVDERLDGDFAFIHDSSEIKYEISRNCNFTEVGDVFAEKPYAIAVQQGSHLQDIISIRILDLQRDRFFEHLQAKYWNNSARGDCGSDIDSEGITLESLGGVFIATLFGLALAMITLAVEVFYYKRKNKAVQEFKKPTAKEPIKTIKIHPETVTIGTTFKPMVQRNLTPRVSHISVYPRNRISDHKDKEKMHFRD